MKSLFTFVLPIIVLMPLFGYAQKISADTDQTVYQTEHLIITRLTDNVYEHTSFLNSGTFGKAPCNGMIVANKNEAVIFDTPVDDTSSAELIRWIKSKLNCKIKAVIATHFHEDCVGGLKEFNKNGIPSYANRKTIELAKAKQFNVPARGFTNTLILALGDKKVYAAYFGEGHTKDNIVGYFPGDKVLFGGCLIKAMGWGKGNLEDANVQQWAETVQKVKDKYQSAGIVIPGHGDVGNKDLLDYTIQLFETR